jgi:transglutaminase-like putative cysteine protease
MQKTLLRHFYILLGLLAVCFISINSYAGTPVVHSAHKPAWISVCKPYTQKPSARDIEDGAYNELIEEQLNIETHASYNHIITQIISQNGVQNNSELSVSFNPAYERLDFHEIIVWRDGKPQNRLTTSAFKILADESEFDRFIYNGTYAAKYILADIRKGDKIEYSYTLTGANPIFNGRYARSIYFQGYSILVHQYTSVLASGKRKLNMKPFNANPKMVTTDIAGGLKRYEWESYQVKSVRSSNRYQPGWYSEFQRVQVSDYASWADVVDWAMKINPATTTFKGELATVVNKLKAEAGNNKELYFRNAVKLVQNEVRYMGIETGEYSHRANDPDKVFKQRYGDCKDKSLLLVSILKAGGIEAYMALISTSLKAKLDDFIPSPALFNHAVAVAIVNGKQVWIDATIGNQGGQGTNIYFPAYRRGLILKTGTNALTQISLTPSGKTFLTETYNVPNEKDSTELEVKTRYTLNAADDIRDRLASSGTAETEKTYLDYYSKIYPSIQAKDSLTVIDNVEKNELTTVEHYNIGKYLKLDTTDNLYHGEFYANAINEQLPKVNGQTKTPVSVNFPLDIDYTVKLVLPLSWSIAEKEYNILRSDYEYHSNRKVDGDTLTLHYSFKYLHEYIPANKLNEFTGDVKELSDQKLAFNFTYTPPGTVTTKSSEVNTLMIIFVLAFISGFIYLALRIYRKPTSSIRQHGYFYGRTLGGWLVLPMIGLFIAPISVLRFFADASYFKMSLWDTYTVGIKAFLFRGLLMYETGGNILTACLAIFCLVLMFKKRDIAPFYVSALYIYITAFLIFDCLFAVYFSIDTTTISTSIIRAIVGAAIWIPYFRVSMRVKETFIEPYPHHNIIWQGDDIMPAEETNDIIETTPKSIEGSEWDGV